MSQTWDLQPLYAAPDDPALLQDLAAAPESARAFRDRHRGRLAELDAAGLLAVLTEYETLQEQLARPQLYAWLLFAADSADPVNQRLSQQASEIGNAAARELLFLDLELITLPEEQYRRLEGDPLLAGYRHFLAATRRFKPHTLPEAEERLLKQKALAGVEAFSRLFDELSASFRFRLDLEGEEREYTGEELLAFLHHPDATLRERAFSAFLERHAEERVVYGAVLNTVALDHAQELELRNYADPLAPTHLANEVEPAVVERLMAVSADNYPLAQEYFRLKARLLGVKRLRNSDIYAPLVESPRRFSFDEARELVLEAYGTFDPECREIAAAFFREGRLDVAPRPGKSGGAFCMGMTPRLSPYVLLNFTGTSRDVGTLAHELGHGIHFVLAGRQSLVNYHPPLPLAETASVFGEMLLARMLLSRENDRQLRIGLLCSQIEEIIATTLRQNVLTRFEERFHRERADGLVTVERICDLWWEENGKLYGDAVEMLPAYRWGWSYISHFIHSRFYCYAYTFAELLVLALYRRYQQEGSVFVPQYKELLASGGSLAPADAVRRAGIDLQAPAFWQQGYDLVAELLEELRALV